MFFFSFCLSFSFSPLLTVCMLVYVCTRVYVLNHLQFSFLASYSLDEWYVETPPQLFYFSAACFRLSQQLIFSSLYFLFSLFHYYLNNAYVYVCIYVCVCVQRAYVYMAYVHIYVYVYVSMYVSIFFFLSYYYIYHGIICVQIAASQRNKRYSRHLGIFLAIGRDSFLFHSVFIFFLPFCFSLLRSFCKRSRNDFSNK